MLLKIRKGHKMDSKNQLQILVRDSGLETTKSQYILEKFTSYFQIAAEWEVKAKALKVTDDTQYAEMQMARTGRLFLREKRITIEKTRKELKEQALREGKAIDGIANVLKGLIEPIESYLDEQEHFAENKAKAAAEAARIESERLAEVERIAKEQAEAKKRVRVQEENERLKKEAEAREAQAALERKKHQEEIERREMAALQEREKQELILSQERAKAKKAQDKADADKKEAEEKNKKAREDAEAKAKMEKEAILAKERKKIEAERAEKERLEKILANQIECPHCHKKFQRGVQ